MTHDSECTGDELLSRMRAAIDGKTFSLTGGNGWHYLMERAIAELKEARVERDRYRVALEEIVSPKIQDDGVFLGLSVVQDIAEKALKGGEL